MYRPTLAHRAVIFYYPRAWSDTSNININDSYLLPFILNQSNSKLIDCINVSTGQLLFP